MSYQLARAYGVVPVYGLPQHQTVFSVEIVWELGDASVREIEVRLERAVGQHLVLPLGQNDQALTTRGHNLHIRRFNTIRWVFKSTM